MIVVATITSEPERREVPGGSVLVADATVRYDGQDHSMPIILPSPCVGIGVAWAVGDQAWAAIVGCQLLAISACGDTVSNGSDLRIGPRTGGAWQPVMLHTEASSAMGVMRDKLARALTFISGLPGGGWASEAATQVAATSWQGSAGLKGRP